MATARPMCWAWYERAGDYRPWHFHAEGCRCGMNAHALPGQHGEHCPVRQHHDRTEMLDKLPWDKDGLLTSQGDSER